MTDRMPYDYEARVREIVREELTKLLDVSECSPVSCGQVIHALDAYFEVQEQQK